MLMRQKIKSRNGSGITRKMWNWLIMTSIPMSSISSLIESILFKSAQIQSQFGVIKMSGKEEAIENVEKSMEKLDEVFDYIAHDKVEKEEVVNSNKGQEALEKLENIAFEIDDLDYELMKAKEKLEEI